MCMYNTYADRTAWHLERCVCRMVIEHSFVVKYLNMCRSFDALVYQAVTNDADGEVAKGGVM